MMSHVIKGKVALIGIPFDGHSSHLRGPAEAPARIREVLFSGAGNLCVESGLDLSTEGGWLDAGDLFADRATEPPAQGEAFFREIESEISSLLERDARTVVLGGDHSITYPILKAYARKYTGLNVLQIDAHPDLYDELGGNRLSHACPFARIMEEKLVSRLVQIGIRAATPHQREQARRFGVEMIEIGDWPPGPLPSLDGPLYLSIDMDGFDPAYAPGVSHPEPGGLTPRDVLGALRALEAPIVGADIVELNPQRDLSSITASLAAKLAKEIVARMLPHSGSP